MGYSTLPSLPFTKGMNIRILIKKSLSLGNSGIFINRNEKVFLFCDLGRTAKTTLKPITRIRYSLY